MRISDWSSDVCSSDLRSGPHPSVGAAFRAVGRPGLLLAAVLSGSTLFFILALSLTTVADVLVILAAAPMTAAVFGWLFISDGVPLRTCVAIQQLLAGHAFMLSEDPGSGSLLGALAAPHTRARNRAEKGYCGNA